MRTVSATINSAPLGPSKRRYANSTVVLANALDPPVMLKTLKAIERQFGTRRGGRWQARVLDLDIILWSGGIWASRTLAIPHPEFRKRPFVLRPAVEIAPDWMDPVTALSLRQLNARLTKACPAPS